MKFPQITSATFILFFISLVVLGITHNIAMQFSLYWIYLWLDIPMHFLGGLVVALGFLSASEVHTKESYKRGLLLTLAVVFAVGACWEFFEYATDLISYERLQHTLLSDIVGDLIADLLGGFAGYMTARTVASLDA